MKYKLWAVRADGEERYKNIIRKNPLTEKQKGNLLDSWIDTLFARDEKQGISYCYGWCGVNLIEEPLDNSTNT